MKYFSAFSGIGGFEQAIHSVFPDAECVGFSETDKYAIQVYKKHYPNHKNYGDITKIDITGLPDFDMLVGGSPCQDLSIAKKDRKGLRGDKSRLFYKFVEILEKKKPRWFLLENVASMSRKNKDKISRILKVQPVMINATLVSAQNRKRLFWANFLITQPLDRGILLKDVLEDGCVENLKSYCIDANYYKGANLETFLKKKKRQLVSPQRIDQIGKGGQGERIFSSEGKFRAVSTVNNQQPYIIDHYNKRIKTDGKTKTIGTNPQCETSVAGQSVTNLKGYIRKLTPVECERLQCFPDGFTDGVSNTQRYKCLGNAVNVEVVKHIMECLKLVVWEK